VDGDGTPELLFDGSTDAASENGAGQPEFLEHGMVRALAGSYVEVEGPKTPIDICPC
jgi:expansin (peptidoglycan-binding protein)